jgi:septal ring factor EnvC (AmiA/AmiB activator)
MVEATKPNENQNGQNIPAQAQSGPKSNTLNLSIKAQTDGTKDIKASISAARGTIHAIVYNNSKENKQAFSDLLKAVSETDSLKLIKSSKRTIKHEFKSVYRQFSKESPAECVEHMKKLYNYTFVMLEALRSNKAFKELTDMDTKLAKSKEKAYKRVNYHIDLAKRGLEVSLKNNLRIEKHLEKKVARRTKKLSSMKDGLSNTKKEIKELNSEKNKIEKYSQPNQYLRK